MKKNKVLIIGPNIDMDIYGGIVTHMKLLLSLNNIPDFHFKLHNFTIGKRKTVGEKIGIFNLIKSYYKFITHLLIYDYKIIHINASMKNGSIVKNSFVLLLTKLFFKKTIFQFHGGEINDISKNLIFLFKFIVYTSDKILVLTPEQAKIKKYLKYSQRNKIIKIPNFIDIKDIQVKNNNKLENIHFLFVGRIISEKGVFELLEASKKLLNNKLNFRISIMGDGPELITLKNKVNELNISKYFIFCGFITEDMKKQAIYTSSDVMVFPSYKEGFPYTILEAMLFSMPIISTNVGALQDIIIESKNGFLINPQNSNELYEKMKYFIVHPSKIKNMGENSFNLVNSKYSILQMKTMLNNLYKEVL